MGFKKHIINKYFSSKISSSEKDFLKTDYLIDMVKDHELLEIGSGNFSDVYEYYDINNPKNNKVIIETKNSNHHSINDFEERQKYVELLKKIGVKTPSLLDIKVSDGITYEIQEMAPGNVLGYNTELAYLYFRNNSRRFQTFINNDYVFNNYNDLSSDRYNLLMTKYRISTGKPHIQKFINDYLKLRSVGAFEDIHRENILYDDEFGYSFIDLTMDDLIKSKLSTKNPAILLKAINDNYLKASYLENFTSFFKCEDYKNTTLNQAYRDFFAKAIGIESENSISKPPKLNDETFEKYALNGLLLSQFLYVINNSENDIQKGSQSDARFEIYKDLFAMKTNDLPVLLKAINNDYESQKLIREKFNLSNNFDFNENMDSRFFKIAMENNSECFNLKNLNNENVIENL